MNQTRRTFLKGSLAGSAVALAVGAGLLTPRAVLAAWPKKAFDADKVEPSMEALFGTVSYEPSNELSLRTPDIAENGSVVPVTVSAKMAGVETISVFAIENTKPLAVSADFSAGARTTIATRIKLGKTSKILAVARANGKLYGTTRTIKVTLGGCGG